MSIFVERNRLLPAVQGAARAGQKAQAILILKHILLRPGKQRLEVVGTDLDLRYESSVEAEVNGSALEPTTVHGDTLAHILSGFPDGGHVSLDWSNKEDRHVTVQCGRSRYKLQALLGSDYPDSRTVNAPCEFSMGATELSRALSFVNPFAQFDASRRYLSGVHLHIGNDNHRAFGNGPETERLVFAATTAREFARCSVPLPGGAGLPPKGIILPESMIDQIVRFLRGDGEIVLTIGENLAVFKNGDSTLSTRLLDETFPEYTRVMPKGDYIEVEVNAIELTAALKRLCAIGNDTRTLLQLEKGGLKFTLTNPDAGSAEEVVEASCAGKDDLTINIHGRAFLSALECLTDAKRVLIRFTDKETGILMNEIANGVDYSRMTLTMPMLPDRK